MTDSIKELTGCACRWDEHDNRVATCVRHQGWLDVVQEWAERAKYAESQLQSQIEIDIRMRELRQQRDRALDALAQAASTKEQT